MLINIYITRLIEKIYLYILKKLNKINSIILLNIMCLVYAIK